MERGTWKLTLPYVKQIANRNLLYGSEPQTGALYQRRGVGDGREVQTVYFNPAPLLTRMIVGKFPQNW